MGKIGIQPHLFPETLAKRNNELYSTFSHEFSCPALGHAPVATDTEACSQEKWKAFHDRQLGADVLFHGLCDSGSM